jgi:hypothetical protein
MSYASHNANASPEELRTIFELVKIFPNAPPAQLLAQLRAANGNKNLAIEFFLAAQAAEQPVMPVPVPSAPPQQPQLPQVQQQPQPVAQLEHINSLQANLEAVYERSLALMAEQLKELKAATEQRDQEIAKLKKELQVWCFTIFACWALFWALKIRGSKTCEYIPKIFCPLLIVSFHAYSNVLRS